LENIGIGAVASPIWFELTEIGLYPEMVNDCSQAICKAEEKWENSCNIY
jgi:hypothetical protein